MEYASLDALARNHPPLLSPVGERARADLQSEGGASRLGAPSVRSFASLGSLRCDSTTESWERSPGVSVDSIQTKAFECEAPWDEAAVLGFARTYHRDGDTIGDP